MMQSIVLRIAVWVLAEVVLTAIGTDDIADYGEYVFKVRGLLTAQQLAFTEYACADGTCLPRSLQPEVNPVLVGSTFA